uniref:proline-rich membrane anchor 1 n=1 Tax=Myxine glutinosa TaxID=7769 RepID=UPI00358FA4BA
MKTDPDLAINVSFASGSGEKSVQDSAKGLPVNMTSPVCLAVTSALMTTLIGLPRQTGHGERTCFYELACCQLYELNLPPPLPPPPPPRLIQITKTSSPPAHPSSKPPEGSASLFLLLPLLCGGLMALASLLVGICYRMLTRHSVRKKENENGQSEQGQLSPAEKLTDANNAVA